MVNRWALDGIFVYSGLRSFQPEGAYYVMVHKVLAKRCAQLMLLFGMPTELDLQTVDSGRFERFCVNLQVETVCN